MEANFQLLYELQIVDYIANTSEDLIYSSETLDVVVDAFLLIPVDKRSCLGVIYIETLLDSLLVVVRTTTLLATINQASHQLILRNSQLNHSSHLVTTLSQHFLQSLSLWSSTWETIEDNTLVILTETIIYASEDINHQFIRNQLTIVDVPLSSLTEFCTVFDFITQYVTCRNVTETIFLDHLVALCALTCTWSAENYDIFYLSLIYINFMLLFLNNRVDISEVTALLVIVETIADDEVVRDFHDSIVNVQVYLEVTWLHKK